MSDSTIFFYTASGVHKHMRARMHTHTQKLLLSRSPPPLQVDSSTFTADFATRQALAARPDLGDGGNLRPVVDLLVRVIHALVPKVTVANLL
eukprot:71231-Pelagomonas_calceolata.AAC.1